MRCGERDVTEPDKDLPRPERKKQALERLQIMEGPSLWVKTADVVSNVSEMLDDYPAQRRHPVHRHGRGHGP